MRVSRHERRPAMNRIPIYSRYVNKNSTAPTTNACNGKTNVNVSNSRAGLDNPDSRAARAGSPTSVPVHGATRTAPASQQFTIIRPVPVRGSIRILSNNFRGDRNTLALVCHHEVNERCCCHRLPERLSGSEKRTNRPHSGQPWSASIPAMS